MYIEKEVYTISNPSSLAAIHAMPLYLQVTSYPLTRVYYR